MPGPSEKVPLTPRPPLPCAEEGERRRGLTAYRHSNRMATNTNPTLLSLCAGEGEQGVRAPH
jgi:hypothetical protein